jgi:hypothetical protein
MIDGKTIFIVFITYLSTVAGNVTSLWIEKGAVEFSDITQIGYATVFLVAFVPAATTLIAKLQNPPIRKDVL